MGIQDLLSSLKKRHPAAVRENIELIQFKGHRVGFDVSIYSYAYMYAARGEVLKHQEDLREDPNPRLVRSCFLENYFDLVMSFVECGITLVPVFDGPPFRLKSDTKDKRVETWKAREAKIAELRFKISESPGNDLIRDDLMKELQSHISFTKEDWDALEDMLRVIGLPVVKGRYEAEAVCARMFRAGLVSAVVTNDGDCLAHQAGIMIRNVKRSSRKGTPKHTCTVILLADVLSELGLTMPLFIDFCMLLGCDYLERMNGCGFVNALKHLKSEGSLEGVVALWRKKGKVPDDHRILDADLIREIRGYFTDELADSLPDFPLVLRYQHGLGNCFNQYFVSWTRDKMRGQVPTFVKILEDFNQLFASLQKFILVSKEDVESGKFESGTFINWL